MLTETLKYGEVYGTILKKEDKPKGRRLGKTLVSGINFSGRRPVYSVLRRSDKNVMAGMDRDVECYQFTDFVIDERGLVIRDAIQYDLSDSEKEFADKTLKRHGL